MNRSLAALALLALSSCAYQPKQRRAPPPPSPTAQLAALGDAYWQFHLKTHPVSATYLGDRRYDTELEDVSQAAIEARRKKVRELARDAEALDAAKLTPEERVTREVLVTMLRDEVGLEICELELWNVNAMDGVQTTLGELAQLHGISTPEQARTLGVRYEKAAAQMEAHVANLERGLAQGYAAAKPAAERVLSQVERMLAAPAESSSFVTVALPSDWPEAQKAQVRAALTASVVKGVYPALARYRDYLKATYLPRARENVAVSANPNGPACYQARIRAITGSDLSPQAIHDIGLDQLAKNEAGMKVIARKRVKSDSIDKLEKSLRRDPTQRVTSREQVLEYNRKLVENAKAALPLAFGKVSERKLEVKPIEAFREQDAAEGYYYEGDEAGTRPGYYYLNTSNPTARVLFNMESLAFHEGVPGHHTQISTAQDLQGIPTFRRQLGATAFVEGWAHYAELLADELGLYSGDAARFGMYSDQAMRAVRLVVDTGLHSLGWSRQKAIDFMVDHTAESREVAEREIDRYIVWPGQALAYKLGQLELLALREEAKTRLGDRFDLKAFHDRILGAGALPLPVLRRTVKEWIATQEAPATAAAP